MPKPCSICHHPEYERIAVHLHGGTPLRQIARDYKVALASLSRHKHHVANGSRTEPEHLEHPGTRRPTLAPEVATALREDLERLRHVLEDDLRLRVSERYLLYATGILDRLIEALSV